MQSNLKTHSEKHPNPCAHLPNTHLVHVLPSVWQTVGSPAHESPHGGT